MQAVIFIGLQGAGKSTFYERHFAATHLRISMDLANTRAREYCLIETCIASQRDFVIDNTNATIASRESYLRLANQAGYRTTGYFFIPDLKASLDLISRRTDKAKLPVPGSYRTTNVRRHPDQAEGFTDIFEVRLRGAECAVSPFPR